MPGPYSGFSQDRLLALANATNATEYVLGEDLTFASPVVINEAGFNTRVRVNPIDVIKYMAQNMRYKRLSLSILQPLADATVIEDIELPFSIHDILSRVNTILQLDLQPDEVANTTYTTSADGFKLEIASNTSSYGWIKSAVNLNITVLYDNARLLEDGTVRLLEDGSARLLEDPVI